MDPALADRMVAVVEDVSMVAADTTDSAEADSAVAADSVESAEAADAADATVETVLIDDCEVCEDSVSVRLFLSLVFMASLRSF